MYFLSAHVTITTSQYTQYTLNKIHTGLPHQPVNHEEKSHDNDPTVRNLEESKEE